MRKLIKKLSNSRNITQTPCESCAYYDIIDEDGSLGCTIDIDEDEAYAEKSDPKRGCPFYKFYDEYKSVQKQN